MLKAKIFENGRSQAVRLPKECRFNSDTNEVSVMQFGMVRLLHGIGLKIRLKMQLMQLKNLILLLNQQIIYDPN